MGNSAIIIRVKNELGAFQRDFFLLLPFRLFQYKKRKNKKKEERMSIWKFHSERRKECSQSNASIDSSDKSSSCEEKTCNGRRRFMRWWWWGWGGKNYLQDRNPKTWNSNMVITPRKEHFAPAQVWQIIKRQVSQRFSPLQARKPLLEWIFTSFNNISLKYDDPLSPKLGKHVEQKKKENSSGPIFLSQKKTKKFFDLIFWLFSSLPFTFLLL